MQQELERIFRLLGLLYPHLDVHSAYVGLQSKSISVHDNALEFLDNVLKPQLREMLVPLLDGKITIHERVRLAGRLVHTTIENQEQAVAALIASDDPWLRSCGAYAVGAVRPKKSLEGELHRCLSDRARSAAARDCPGSHGAPGGGLEGRGNQIIRSSAGALLGGRDWAEGFRLPKPWRIE